MRNPTSVFLCSLLLLAAPVETGAQAATLRAPDAGMRDIAASPDDQPVPTTTPNLASFEVRHYSGRLIRGYAEPADPRTSSGDPARVYVLPELEIPVHGVSARDDRGHKIGAEDIDALSPGTEVKLGVTLELHSAIASDDDRHLVMWSLFPGLPKPMLERDRPLEPVATGDRQTDAINAQRFASEVRRWHASRAGTIQKLHGHRFVTAFPRGIELKLLVDNDPIGQVEVDQDAIVTSASRMRVNTRTTDIALVRQFLEGDFAVQAAFEIPVSRFQRATAVRDLKGFSNYSAQEFQRIVRRARSQSRGFLFWKSTSRSITEFAEQTFNEASTSSIASEFRYSLRDADPSLRRRVEAFLFPNTTLQETIAAHLDGARKAADQGNSPLADAHRKYAELLTANAADLASVNHIDALAALSALARKDVVGFLAKGVAFADASETGSFTFRRLTTSSHSTSEVHTFNALILTAMQERVVQFVAPPPEAIASVEPQLGLAPQGMVLVDGGDVVVGQPLSAPAPLPGAYVFGPSLPTERFHVESFYLATHEVTQREWKALMGSNPSAAAGNRLPVTNLSWYDAIEYSNRKSAAEGLAPAYRVLAGEVVFDAYAAGYRLPTRAEWEFAAKGGSKSRTSNSASRHLDEVAWCGSNSNGQVRLGGRKSPNELGIFDMLGNVLEWNWEARADTPLHPNGLHTSDATLRHATRGGSVLTRDSLCTTYSSLYYLGTERRDDLGLRLARSTSR